MDVQYQEDAVNAPEEAPLASKTVFSSKSRAEGVRSATEVGSKGMILDMLAAGVQLPGEDASRSIRSFICFC